jgi:hypothetical protein
MQIFKALRLLYQNKRFIELAKKPTIQNSPAKKITVGEFSFITNSKFSTAVHSLKKSFLFSLIKNKSIFFIENGKPFAMIFHNCISERVLTYKISRLINSAG